MTSRGLPLLLAALVWTLVHGCGAGVDPEYRRIVEDPPPAPIAVDELAATDRFELRVAGEDELSGAFTVPTVGGIDYSWIGEVVVAGRTCNEVAREISGRLADGFLLNPSVSCQILEINSRRIDVIGEVNRPGSYPFEDEMSILRAIARAEGFSDDAAPNATSVLRVVDGQELRVRIPVEDIIAGVEPNFPLHPGDTVVVPRFVFIP
jgi:protein involved in polysaccharide export with SLBB domain